MSNIYRSARGDKVDMDLLRVSNENTIAIGNMRTNARGDELGPGGKIVRTRAQIMADYHKLNTPVAQDTPVTSSSTDTTYSPQKPLKKMTAPVAENLPVAESNTYTKPRGSLADAIAKESEVQQELLEPAKSRNSDGVKRI